MKNESIDKEGSAVTPIITIALVTISIVAGVLDTYFYGEFISTKGISRWSMRFVHPKFIFEYFTSFTGAILTIFSLSPWLFILGVVYLPGLKKKEKL
jgi:hypothetical protein